MKILGIDPGAGRNTGFAWLDTTTREVSTALYVSYKDDLRGLYAYALEQFDKKPDALVVEQPCGGFQRALVKLSMNYGVLSLAAQQRGLSIIPSSPTHMKKVVTGKGRCKKGEVAAALKKIFGDEKLSEHAWDALGHAYAYARHGSIDV